MLYYKSFESNEQMGKSFKSLGKFDCCYFSILYGNIQMERYVIWHFEMLKQYLMIMS